MSQGFYTIFPTALNDLAIAWSDDGILTIQLPEKNSILTLESLRARTPIPLQRCARIDLWVKNSMKKIQAHLEARPVDLRDIPLAMDHLPPFHQRVYAAARMMFPGEVLSYAELATRAGSPKASRAVGQAMAKNPFPIVVPCHRILASGGRAGGFSAPGGITTKARLLRAEGYPALFA